MADHKPTRSETDPSFIRKPGDDLVEFARRLGLSTREVREAVDGGLIRPAAPRQAHPRVDRRNDGPGEASPERWG